MRLRLEPRSRPQDKRASDLPVPDVSASVKTRWRQLRDAVHSTAVDVLGCLRHRHCDLVDEDDAAICNLLSEKNGIYRPDLDGSIDVDRNETKNIFDAIKAIDGHPTKETSLLLSSDRPTCLTENSQVLEHWAEHFRSVLGRLSTISDDTTYWLLQVEIKVDPDLPPSLPEAIHVVQQLFGGNSSGSDAIPDKICKHGGHRLVDQLTALCREMWRHGQASQNFKNATIVRLYKRKGDRQSAASNMPALPTHIPRPNRPRRTPAETVHQQPSNANFTSNTPIASLATTANIPATDDHTVAALPTSITDITSPAPSPEWPTATSSANTKFRTPPPLTARRPTSNNLLLSPSPHPSMWTRSQTVLIASAHSPPTSAGFGLSKRTWEILELKSDSVKFKIFSPDGDEGFPGNLTVYVTYRITINSEEKIELSIDYFASVAGGITPLSLTNHTYYNLAGHLAGPEALDRHIACIAADRLLETEGDLIPTGRIQRVEEVDGADLRKPVSLKNGLQKIQPAPYQGYDEYYIFNQIPPDEAKVTVSEPNSGRRVEAFSDQLGIQFYTGNCLEPKTDPVGKNGYSYPQHSGFCIELHGFPDAVNKPNFPQCFITPHGKPYTQKSKYVFSF
ncbi:hypothetical protein SprV_0100443100 [Sparganum proliferum]